jgi:hypothetical protein
MLIMCLIYFTMSKSDLFCFFSLDERIVEGEFVFYSGCILKDRDMGFGYFVVKN